MKFLDRILKYKLAKFRVNKKILFLILLGAILVPTMFVLAATDLPTMATNIETAAVGVGTPIVVVGWVIAGILWLTSAGSPEKTGTAKKAIFACVIGTILIVLAAVSKDIMDLVSNTFGL